MNSRRRISAPKVSGQHCIGSNGDVDRAQTGIETIAAVHSQCRRWVISLECSRGRRPCISATPPKADVNSPPWLPPLMCKVEMWRGGCRSNISVSASFVWRCLSGATMTPFPHPSHRTGHEDFPHPALGQDFTPSPTARRAQAGTGARARSTRKGARVDTSRPCVA